MTEDLTPRKQQIHIITMALLRTDLGIFVFTPAEKSDISISVNH